MKVYWSCTELEGLRAKEPERIIKKISKNALGYERCPSFIEKLNNVFGVSFIYDFDLQLDREENNLSSKNMPQDFFDEHVNIRDIEKGYLSFLNSFVFFTEEKSLNMSIIPSYLEDNDFNRNVILTPGVLDIGKYFRPTDCAFQFRQESTEIECKEGDTFMYVDFDTNENIEFVQFTYTEGIKGLVDRIIRAKENRFNNNKFRPLKYWYSLFKSENLKNQILNKIRKQCE